MRLLYLAGRELSYPRNDVILRAIKQLGNVEIIGLTNRPNSLILSSIYIAFKAFPKLLFNKYDLIFVGFFGYLLIYFVSLFSKRPIIFDAFISTFDTLSGDRKVIGPKSLLGRLAFGLDRTATHLASKIILDTPLHADFFVETFNISPEKVYTLPVGCNEDLFYPQPQINKDNSFSNILFYSSYMPLHGVETVVKAAKLLQSESIEFRLIGEGPCYKDVQQLVKTLKIKNIDFVDPVPLIEIPSEIAAADICLGGHFGLSSKAGRVIPGKIYQILAMARPLIGGDTPANRALLTHGESAHLSTPGDPEELANSIMILHNDPLYRDRLAAKGRSLFEKKCSEAIIKDRLLDLIS
jgi:glycosyltransferase involved in cell wall biosynthesis